MTFNVQLMKHCWVLSLFFALILAVPITAKGQVSKNPCLYNFLTEKSGQEKLLDSYKHLYDFKSKERIASVGAGGGSKEIAYSMMADSLVFYLQDIDSTCLTESKLSLTVRQIYDASSRTCNAKFIPVIGTKEDTKLPNSLDKVIMENTMHELTYPEKTLSGIRKSLKPNGFLFIEDFIAEKPGQKHRGCKKVLYTEEALVGLLGEFGFQLIESNYVYPKNTEDRLYKFSLK